MNNAIKWSELTPEQKDRLIAEKVMNWQEKQCDGEHGEVSGGWFCTKCGHDGNWGDSFEHTQLPPRYTQSLDAIKPLRQRMAERFPLLNLYLITYTYNRCYAAFSDSPEYEDRKLSEGNGEHCMEEAICKAALRACGVEIEP